VDRFVPVEGAASDQVTKFVVDYLKKAEIPVNPMEGPQSSPDNADVTMTGQIESYWIEALTRFGRTELRSKNRLRIKLTNLSDGSTIQATVGGEATTKVVSFSHADLEKLTGEALGQSLARFLADVTVSDRSFKPKRED
jgi:hypothetical protein